MGRNYDEKHESICWKCSRPLIGGCEWVESGKPVSGWKTTEKIICHSGDRKPRIFYDVYFCPKFTEEKIEHDIHSEKNTDGYINLANCIAKSLISDYISAKELWERRKTPDAKRELMFTEKALKSEWFELLTGISGDEAINLINSGIIS